MSRSAPFYEAVFSALGYSCVRREDGFLGFGIRNSAQDDGHSYVSIIATGQKITADGRHWCFRAPDRSAVDAFHAAGLAAGGRDDGSPGLRPDYHAGYYAAFLRDPDGDRIEAVCHRAE